MKKAPKYRCEDFSIETFEIGRGLWHARFRRIDGEPMSLDGVAFETLNVGMAWPSAQAAMADAVEFIERMMAHFAARTA